MIQHQRYISASRQVVDINFINLEPMNAYANALLYAIPAFVVLVLIEIAYGHVVKNQKYRFFDTLSSLSSGVTNVLKDSLGLALVLISYPFLE